MLLSALLAALFAGPQPVTFSHDVAPILYRNCAACHRPGGVAPFSLLTYADAAKRAGLIATVTRTRYMPPWLPSEPRFAHERKLSAAEIAVLARWAAIGAPQGNPAQTPPVPTFALTTGTAQARDTGSGYPCFGSGSRGFPGRVPQPSRAA
jgi:mono/diheme cytochrome c family protein